MTLSRKHFKLKPKSFSRKLFGGANTTATAADAKADAVGKPGGKPDPAGGKLELKESEKSDTPLEVLATATSTVLLTSDISPNVINRVVSDENSDTIEKVLLNNWKDLYKIVDELSSTPDKWSIHKSKIIMYAQEIGALALTNSMGSNDDDEEEDE